MPMLRNLGRAIHRGFFWTYARGTWQYDIMVILILAFIFLTPRQWFQDRPSPSSTLVVLLESKGNTKIYQLPAVLLDAQPGESIEGGAQRVLSIYTGKALEVTRMEPAMDAKGRVVSYAVWVKE